MASLNKQRDIYLTLKPKTGERAHTDKCNIIIMIYPRVPNRKTYSYVPML